jgi:hypothetical protein
MRRVLPMLALPLLAQTQPTFYAAFEDGRDLERKGDWKGAYQAYQRAASLRPGSAPQVLIYGNNLLRDYFPYTRMARCLAELGDLEAAETELSKAQAQHEPVKEREALGRRVRELREARQIKETPKPAPVTPVDVPTPRHAESPHTEPVQTHPQPPAPDPASAPAPVPVAPRPSPSSVATAPKPAGRELAPPPVQPPLPEAPKPPAGSPATPEPPKSAPWWPWLLLGIPLGAWLFRRRSAVAKHGEFAEPERIGPYHIERLLGRGGFASTYLARHAQTGQKVALKRLHPYRLEDPEFIGRFHQEARLGARLNHPNLVRLVDPGPSEGQPWIAMEYVEGKRLDVLLKEGLIPLKDALQIALGMAEGLAYAHAEGVVHRDLKPANVILDATGVRIMDFGIARVMDAETLTTTYAFLGTPRYAAPEAQLKTTVGPASDRYSLGIILFEMLIGHPPFQGETPFELLDQHRRAPLPDLAALREELPVELVRLVNRLVAKEPDERPEDAELVRSLRDILGRLQA